MNTIYARDISKYVVEELGCKAGVENRGDNLYEAHANCLFQFGIVVCPHTFESIVRSIEWRFGNTKHQHIVKSGATMEQMKKFIRDTIIESAF